MTLNRLIANFSIAAAIVSLIVSVSLDFKSRDRMSATGVLVQDTLEVDGLVNRVDKTGDLFIRLGEPVNSRIVDYVTAFYFRAEYVLYPRRALVADPNIIINTGIDIREHHFTPDDAWLIAHGVGAEIAVSNLAGTSAIDTHSRIIGGPAGGAVTTIPSPRP